VKLQEALKKEIYTKNQYYDKVNEYQDIVKDIKSQLQTTVKELEDIKSLKQESSENKEISNKRVDELEAKNAELANNFDNCLKELSEQKIVNEIQAKQLILYIEELRRYCATNIEMKNRLEELIKDKEIFQISNEHFKISNEVLQKEKHDFFEQIQKSFMRENEYKKCIQELESKIVQPDNLAYIYNAKKESILSKEDIQVN